MKNRKNLHDYGLVLVVLGVLNLFMFLATLIANVVDGSLAEAFTTVEPDLLVAVKVVLGVLGGIAGLLVFADVLIGLKALKVSKTPNADKGYITAAKVFFVMSVIATVSAIISLFDKSAPVIDTLLNCANSALGAVVYALFIKSAQAVRRDVLNGVQ